MLKRKVFYIITVAVSVLLLGLVTVQIYWVRNAYQLRQVHFDEKMNRALQQVAASADEMAFSFYLYGRSYINPGEGVMMLKTDYKSQKVTDTVPLFNVFPYNNAAKDTCFYSTNISYYDRLTLVDVSMKFTYKQNDTTFNVPDKNKEFKDLTLSNFRTKLDDAGAIAERLNTGKLDSVFALMLRNEDIDGAYVYGLRKKGAKKFEYTSGTLDKKLLNKPGFTTKIFSDIPFVAPYELKVYIDNKEKFISRSLVSALGVSFLIILLLVAAFIYFAYTVLKQKRLSQMKTDFINNMTHEFMTPVTNIGLALETLEKQYDAEVLNIIGAENILLKDNINKVLQLATLEKGSYQLDLTELDIHSLLHRVVKNFNPQLIAKQGQITFDLQARHTQVLGDETHVINLFYNIVDNAIKYSGTNPPLISITTSDEKGKLKVVITDKGIGMTDEVRSMIFERFYRGQKGNRHDVKGFGLGLAYVQSIADAHGIQLAVDSKPGVGTSFYLRFKTIT